MPKAKRHDDGVTTGKVELQHRNGIELAAAVRAYRRLRTAHPVPAGWTEDVSGLLAAPGVWGRGHEPDPFVAFSRKPSTGYFVF